MFSTRMFLPWTKLCALFSLAWTGCATTASHRHDYDRNGMVLYFDGAGGGGILTHWGRGVKLGLRSYRCR